MVNKGLALAITGVLLLTILGFMMAIGAKVNTDVKEGTADISQVTVTERAYTSAGAVLKLVTVGDIDSPANIGGFACGNSTVDNITMSSGNWTVDVTQGTVNFTLCAADGDIGCEATGTVFACNYTGSAYNTAWAAGINATKSLTDLSTWNTTIATILAAIIIISMLMGGFGAYMFFKK